MPILPLDDWDDAYLDEVAKSDETGFLEKKAGLMFDPADRTQMDALRAEIAVQVCAFSNAGRGYLVFGIGDKTRQLDRGVPEYIGKRYVKDWVEELIPKQLEPPVHGCRARFMHRASHHQTGFGVLAVEIPLSDARPHWVRGDKEQPYIRAGAHSHPMTRRTFLDIASRAGEAPTGEVLDPELYTEGDVVWSSEYNWFVRLRPAVRLLTGPPCKDWGVELSVPPGGGAAFKSKVGDFSKADGAVYIPGKGALFPRRTARFPSKHDITLLLKNGFGSTKFTVTLYAAASVSTRTFDLPAAMSPCTPLVELPGTRPGAKGK
jgi:hypothetical protein